MKKSILTILALTSLLAAETKSDYSYAKVYNSEPIYKTIIVSEPIEREVNREERVRVNCNSYKEVDTNSLGVDTLLGTAVGAVIGSQIGKGNGRVAAQIAGGLGGGYIANQTRGSRNGAGDCYEIQNKRTYVTDYKDTRKNVISGYKNYFTFENKEYVKTTKEPLRQVRIEKRISF